MKFFTTLLCLFPAFTPLDSNDARGAAFTDLDFESANLPVMPHGQYGTFVPISQALPGWSAFLGTDPVTNVYHNNITLGPAIISVWGPDWSYGIGGRIEGDFTAVLATGSASSGPPLSISQTGVVPLDSHWLLFKGRVYQSPSAVAISLDGRDVPLTALASYQDYSLYGGNISAFAGSEVELRFTVFRGPGNGLSLDSIVFSPVPEPSSVLLSAVGLLAAALASRSRIWGRRHRK